MTFIRADPVEMKAMAKGQGLEVFRPELNTRPYVYYKNFKKGRSVRFYLRAYLLQKHGRDIRPICCNGYEIIVRQTI